MRLLRDKMFPDCATVVAIGDFDGVHLGHIRLIRALVALGGACSAKPLVCTFADNTKGSAVLSAPEEKSALLEFYGAAFAYYADFASVRSLSADDFIETVLKRDLRAVGVVCGPDFRFGFGRGGDISLLRAHGLFCREVPPELVDGAAVSSSRIRTLLESGDVERAATLLGRPCSFTAPVIHGRGVGRKLGFPTVNQALPAGRIMPSDGVYAVLCEWEDGKKTGVCCVGSRPTFGEGERNCETHIIDFSGDLYGRRIKLSFLSRIRDTKRFSSAEALTRAVAADIEGCKKLSDVCTRSSL